MKRTTKAMKRDINRAKGKIPETGKETKENTKKKEKENKAKVNMNK